MPIPPGPVSVSSRTSGSASSALAAARSSSRPSSGVAGAGSGASAGRRRGGAAGAAREVERRVLGEDRRLEALQLAPGVQAELLDERVAGAPVGVERVGLAAGAVEREHQLRRAGARGTGARRSARAARRRSRRGGRARARRPSPPRSAASRRSASRSASLAGGPSSGVSASGAPRNSARASRRSRGRGVEVAGRARAAAAAHERLEALEVELAGLAARRRSPAPRVTIASAGAERAPQLGDVDLERLGRGGRRVLAPQHVDEPLGGDRVVAVREQQHRQQGALLRRADVDRPVVSRRPAAGPGAANSHQAALPRVWRRPSHRGAMLPAHAVHDRLKDGSNAVSPFQHDRRVHV